MRLPLPFCGWTTFHVLIHLLRSVFVLLVCSIFKLTWPVYLLKGICVCVVLRVLVFRGPQPMLILASYCFPLKQSLRKIIILEMIGKIHSLNK